MRELTNELPKPMLRVEGKPILEHIIQGLITAGIREIFIVTGYRADVVESYFGDGSKWNVRIQYGRQEVQDGTGKAPEVAQRFVGNDDFASLVTVTGSEDDTKGGMNFFDDALCLKRLVEKPNQQQLKELRQEGMLKPGATAWYNAGIYIFKSLVYEFTNRLTKSPRGEYELTDALNAMVAAGHRIAGMTIEGRWVDVRDPEVLAALRDAGGEE